MQDRYKSGDKELKPNVVSYNTVINAYAKAGNADRAEAILEEMHQDYEQGNHDAKANVCSFNTVLSAWSRSGSAKGAERAEMILLRMKKLYESGKFDTKPDVISYSIILDCWAKSLSRGSAEKTEKIFREMQCLNSSGDKALKLDVVSYTTVINAWANECSIFGGNEAVGKAQSLLTEMLTLAEKGDSKMMPNTFTYNALLKTIASSSLPDKVERANIVLENMIHHGVERNSFIMNQVERIAKSSDKNRRR
jgi:pentatricopeptide repeat protein